MKWKLGYLAIVEDEFASKKEVELPRGAIPVGFAPATTAPGNLNGYLLFIELVEQSEIGTCQVFNCTEQAVGNVKFEFFVVKVCEKHRKEFASLKG